MKSTILIVEDDSYINNMIRDALELAGYKCIQAFSGTEGILRVENGGIDLAILDLMLPGMNGEDVIKKVKQLSDIPVIVVSAKDNVDSKIELLRPGADDYITKPFDIKELEVRVEIRLRRYLEQNGNGLNAGAAERSDRSDAQSTEEVITYKEIELNPGNYSVKVGNESLDRTF